MLQVFGRKIQRFFQDYVAGHLVALSYSLLLLVVVWSFIPYSLDREYDSNVEEIQKSNDQLAVAFEVYVINSIQTADRHLLKMKQDFEHGGNKSTMLDYFHHNVPSELVNQAFILGKDGRQLYAMQDSSERTDLSSRPYFSAQRDDAARGLYVGEYILGRLTGKPSVFISRRIDAPDGSFGGVAAIAINPAYFMRFAAETRIHEEEMVRLVGKDGVVVAGLDRNRKETGVSMKDTTLFKMLQVEPDGRFFSEGKLFGVPGFYSYRTMKEYPFVVEAGVTARHGLTEYYDRKRLLYTAGIGSTLLVVLYTGAVIWLSRRKHRLEAAAERREINLLHEVQLARKIQTAMLPEIKESAHINLRTVFMPSHFVSGDFFFLEWRHEGNVLCGYLVDVTGHGMSTALYTAALNVLLHEVSETDLSVSDQLRWLNKRVAQYFNSGSFAAAIVFEVDLEMKELRYAGAGITEFWRSRGARVEKVLVPGMYLGIAENIAYEFHKLPLAVGDHFYFLTDGLSESLHGEKEIPADRFDDMVSFLSGLPARQTHLDDATAVCIRIHSLPYEHSGPIQWPLHMTIKGLGDYQRFKGRISAIIAASTGLAHSKAEVAVNEAIANALECRDAVARSHRAFVKFNHFGHRLVVRVKTSRIGFAGNAVLRRLRANPDGMFDFGEDAAMGRGIPLMLSLSDKMTYNDDGTEVLLSWRVDGSRNLN